MTEMIKNADTLVGRIFYERSGRGSARPAVTSRRGSGRTTEKSGRVNARIYKVAGREAPIC